MSIEHRDIWKQFVTVVKDNTDKALTVALIVVVLVGGFFGYRRYQASRYRKASENLRVGVALFYSARQAEQPDFGEAISKLKSVLDSYPGTSAASQALLYLGHIFYELGDYSSSLDKYREALASMSPESPFYEVALFDVAYALEAQQEYEKAKDAYERVLGLERGVLKDRAVLGIGRCYEQLGDIPAAIETFSSILKRFPNSPWVEELRQRLDILQSTRAKAS